MAESMTRQSGRSVEAFLAELDEKRRADAAALVDLMGRVTGERPRMWGDSIVGFGAYHYRYPTGHEGDTCLVGFSPRKNAFSIYLTGVYFPDTAPRAHKLLEKLGKHSMGKACLYVKRLSDIDPKVLEQLVKLSVATLKAHYPASDEPA